MGKVYTVISVLALLNSIVLLMTKFSAIPNIIGFVLFCTLMGMAPFIPITKNKITVTDLIIAGILLLLLGTVLIMTLDQKIVAVGIVVITAASVGMYVWYYNTIYGRRYDHKTSVNR